VIPFETPRGRAVVFAETTPTGHALIVRTPAGERRTLANVETSWPELVYSPSGHLLYRRDPVDSPSIWALPFSATTLTAEGEPFLVERSGQGMSLARDGTLAYLETGRIRAQRLAWRDRTGKVVEQSGHARAGRFRIRRDAVWSRYGPQLNQLYMTESHPHDLF